LQRKENNQESRYRRRIRERKNEKSTPRKECPYPRFQFLFVLHQRELFVRGELMLSAFREGGEPPKKRLSWRGKEEFHIPLRRRDSVGVKIGKENR